MPAGGAIAQQPIGNAVSVIPAAFGQIGGTEVEIILGSSLYEGQRITTSPNGEVQIIFADDTRMVVGPSSALVIERYLMRNPTTVGEMTVNAIGGAFRFITGTSPSDAYRIQTPTGTIGIRGTEFDFDVDWNTGRANVIVFFGSVFLCANSGDCAVLTAACSVGSIIQTTNAEIIEDRRELGQIATQFRYLQNQNSLRNDFQIGNRRSCLSALTRNAPAPQVPDVAAAVQPPVPPPQQPPPQQPPPQQPPPPVEEPSQPAACENDNAGLGNGAECPDEGDGEAGNPGQNNGNGPGNNDGNGNGPGNNNGNGNGPGNNNGNGNGPGNNNGNGNGPGNNNGNGQNGNGPG